MENTNFTINQKMALAALTELNYLFYNFPCFDDRGNYLEPLNGKDWNPMFVAQLTHYINNVYLKKYPNITDTFQKAFDEAMEADNSTFFEKVEYQFWHHLHDGLLARQKIFQKAYAAGDKTSSKEELMRQGPYNCKDTWVINGSIITDSLLWRGLTEFGRNIPELWDINNIIERASEVRAMYMGAMAACPQTNGEAPKSDERTTKRQATDEAENKRKKANKPQPDFKTVIQPINDKSEKEILARLHKLIDGKSGADVGSVLLAALQEGYLARKPARGEYEAEFSLIGSWSAIWNYMDDNNVNALVRANKIIIF